MSDSSTSFPGSAPAATNGAVERKALAKRAGVVGAGTLVSRLLGLVREAVLAALFSRVQTDAFFLAFTIPNALRQLFAEGAVSSAVVPVLSETRAKDGDEAAQKFFQAVRGLSLTSLLIVTALGIAFARPLCEVFAAGYHDVPGQFERTVRLTQWVFPYIFLMGTAALGMAALNTYRRFTVAAFSPGLLNVAIMAFAFGAPTMLQSRGYDPTLALAFGALVGGVLQVVAQWPSLAAIGFLRRPTFAFSHPGVRKVMHRILPMTFGMGVYYIDIALSRRFLSELGVGAQSYFMWAMRLCDFPQGIFIMALSTAALPSLSALAASGQRDEVSKTYAYGMRLAMFVAVPATVLFVALAHPVVVALFQRGAFDAEASAQTSRALVAQGLAIWSVAAVRQLVPVFYSLGNTRTPVIVSALHLVVYIALAIVLRKHLGHVGVGLAVAGSSFVQMFALWAWLRPSLPSLRLREIGSSIGRTLAASLIAGLAAWTLTQWLGMPDGAGWLRRLVPATFGSALFCSVFVTSAWIVRSPELLSFAAALRRRLARFAPSQ